MHRTAGAAGDVPVGDGVGLGLSIAKGFVTAMGGTLLLDDTPGGGLTVTVVLPRSTDPPTDTAIVPSVV